MNKTSNAVAYIKESSREYSLYVNDDRAIPFIGDGMKHVQRVALWLMRNEGDKVKVIGLVGSLMKSGLYVHGDAACADAIGLLAAPYRNNVMLLKGEGQFGSRIAPVEGIGSPRYVSVKRSKAASAFLYIDSDIVPMEDNYDGSVQQPIHYLPLIPVVLLNGISGIGVGYSTEILPHRYEDLVEATLCVLRNKKIKPILPHYDRYSLSIDATGMPNQWIISGKATIVDSSTVTVTELPPDMTLEKFKKRLIDMEDTDQISKFVDRSSSSINIQIMFKRGTIAGWTEQKAIDFFKISQKITERIVVRDFGGNRIAQYSSPEQVVKVFAEWRLAWYETRYQKYSDDSSNELAYWRLLAALFKAGFTKKLGTFANRTGVETDVLEVAKKAKLALGDGHLDRAVSLPTYRWTKDFEAEVGTRITELETKIADYLDILAKPERRRAIYIAELEELRKTKL